jgi:hypothetical protein
MKKILFSLLVLCSTTPGFALMSPLNQSIKEINEILTSRELSQYFHQNDKILEIKLEGENYILKTADKQMLVEVIDVPPQRIGPRQFKLVFHPAQPLK